MPNRIPLAGSAMLRLRRACVALIAATALPILLSGCNTLSSQVNDKIAQRLPAMLGPADHYDVRTSASIFDLMRGKLRDARIHGDNVALAPMLHVRSFDADAKNIHANTRTDAITGIGTTSFHIVMDQSNLDNYMSSARPALTRRGARVTLDSSSIVYSDSVTSFGIKLPFAVTGTLAPHPGNAAMLDFIPSGGEVVRIGIPRPLLDAAVARQNPVVDLSRMTYPVAIDSARVQNGAMTIDGSVNLSSLVGRDASIAAPPRTRI